MLALGCCSKTLEHRRGRFADLFESNLNLDGTTIASDEDIAMAENFQANRRVDNNLYADSEMGGSSVEDGGSSHLSYIDNY